jgi:NTP pyrophosphatase (non-canonical NTP hydrolase)
MIKIDMDTYQNKVISSSNGVYTNDYMYHMVGLMGEVGEVIDYLKKIHYHKHDLDKNKLTEELGDVLWYLISLANVYDISLFDIAEMNLKKINVLTDLSLKNHKKGVDVKTFIERFIAISDDDYKTIQEIAKELEKSEKEIAEKCLRTGIKTMHCYMTVNRNEEKEVGLIIGGF